MEEKTSKRLRFIIDIAYYAVIAILAYLSLCYVIPWTLPFLLALLLVSIVHPVIRWIKRMLHIEREIISFIILLLIYVLVCTLVAFLVTQLVFLFRNIFSNLPIYYEQTIQPAVISIGAFLSQFMQDLPEFWQEQTGALQEGILSTLQSLLLSISQNGISFITGLSGRIPAFLIALLFTVMLSFFISMQYGKVTSFLHSLLPKSTDRLFLDFRCVMKETVVKYLRAALTLMLITFVELSVGFLVLGQPNAILLALGIAVFDALPLFGTGAVMIPWAIIELLQGGVSSALGLAVLYGIITLVRNVIEPKIVGDRLGLNPVASLTAIYVGFRTIGVLGMIIMPILLQMFLALRKKGWFTSRHSAAAEEEPQQPGEE